MNISSPDEKSSKEIYDEAINAINRALAEAKSLAIPLANTASLATISEDKKPSVRTITICNVNTDGLLLFVNKNSGKAAHINLHPDVGLCFYWQGLHLQLLLQGVAVEVSSDEASTWWQKQDRNFQLSAWASNTQNTLQTAEEKRASTKALFADERIPLPSHWTAYRIKPYRIEFWQANWKKHSERYRYTKEGRYWTKHIL